MRAFLIDRYKKGGTLRFSESPVPELRENDVMVEFHAAGVNPLDAKIRDGEFKPILPHRLPLVLGNDVAGFVVDYNKDDFEKVLQGYDVVLNSLGKDTLDKSLGVLKPGGKLISISGPPDPDFARQNGSGWLLRQVMRLLSAGIRRKSKRLGSAIRFSS